MHVCVHACALLWRIILIICIYNSNTNNQAGCFRLSACLELHFLQTFTSATTKIPSPYCFQFLYINSVYISSVISIYQISFCLTCSHYFSLFHTLNFIKWEIRTLQSRNMCYYIKTAQTSSILDTVASRS